MTFKALLNPGGIKKNLSRIFSVDIIINHNMDGVHGKKRLLNYTKIFDALYGTKICYVKYFYVNLFLFLFFQMLFPVQHTQKMIF